MKKTLLLISVAVILMVIVYRIAQPKSDFEPVNNVAERVAEQARYQRTD